MKYFTSHFKKEQKTFKYKASFLMKGDNLRKIAANIQNGSLIAFTNLFCLLIYFRYSYFAVLIHASLNHNATHKIYDF